MAGFLLLFWTFLGGAVTAATAPSPTPRSVATFQPPSYFFTIDLDPRYQFVGAGALTERGCRPRELLPLLL